MYKKLPVFLVLILQIYSISSQEVNDELWGKAEKKCQQLSKLSSIEKASLLTSLGNISRTAKVYKNSNVRNVNHCYVNCFFEQVGLMIGAAVNNTLLNSWLKEEAEISQNKEELYNSIKSCVDAINTEDKCDKAYELYVCFEKR